MNISKIERIILDNLPISDQDKGILNRRINKLKKDPKDFFETSYKKRSKQAFSKLPIKRNGTHSFTVISAVYNVEDYLDDYFKSLVDQSLNFKKHMKIIIVDDGSTDSSAQIIKKWINKYPKNIFYLYKENGGQASARNLGLDYVETEWVTFIDPDDFVSENYFLEIDNFLNFDKDLILVACPLVLYMEDEKIYKDNHPLNYRFKKGKQVFQIKNLENYLQLSVSTAVFKYEFIHNIKFNEEIKPSFEDAKFVLDFFLENIERKMGFIDNIKYFYRKRSAGNSTLDTAWFNPQLFTTVLEQGVLSSLLQAEQKLGYVPTYIQRSALYHVYWYFGRIINRGNSLSHLSDFEKEQFFEMLKLIFSKIENSTIEKFNLGGAWFFHKVGFLGLFKEEEPNLKIAYIEKFDTKKNQVLVKYFSNNNLLEQYSINSRDVIPLYKKNTTYSFYDRVFTNEYRVWLPCDDLGMLNIRFNDENVKITFRGKQYNSLDLADVKSSFINHFKSFEDIWIFIDSSHKADDNAEHLYRYVSNNFDHKLFFALDKSSKDWDRLEHEGFNLIEFGSERFESILKQCDKIISSNIDGYITHYFKDNSLINKDFIFLQHGVILHDLSAWLNTKKFLDLFVTTTVAEYDSITEKGSPYVFTEKEVKLIGLPRHDSLLENNQEGNNTILLMPTWRNNIVGKSIDATTRAYNKEFVNSQYFKYWKSILLSDNFKKLVTDYGYKIIFAPHSNIQMYLSDFEIPNYVQIWQYSDGDIQKLFQECSMMITDYSSVAFEVAYLKKPIIYYQFDRNEVFGGNHTFEEGYFSYEDDGFGPVVINESEFMVELDRIVKNDCKILEPYKERVEKTFPFRDGSNSKRVYDAIIELDRPDYKEIDLGILFEFTQEALKHKKWSLVESRSELLMQNCNDHRRAWAESAFNESLFNLNKFTVLLDSLRSQGQSNREVNYWRAKIAFAIVHWYDVITILESMPVLDDELTLMLLFSYAEVGQIEKFKELESNARSLSLTLVQKIMLEACRLRLYDNWPAIIDLLDSELSNFDEHELIQYQPQILMAQAFRQLRDYNNAHQQLANFESHTVNYPRCRIEIARLAFVRDNYEKTINQYDQAIDDINLLSESSMWQYLQSLWQMNYTEKLLDTLLEVTDIYPDNQNFSILYIKTLAKDNQWLKVLNQASKLERNLHTEIIYPLTLARYRLGLIDEAYDHCVKPTIDHEYKYWRLVIEIALLQEDFELGRYCLKGVIAIFPDKDNQDHWSKLESIRGYT